AILAASQHASVVTRDFVLSLIPPLVNNVSVMQELYVLGLTECNLSESLSEHVNLIATWCNQYQNITYTNNNKIEWKRFPRSKTELVNMCITDVTDIEESVWS
uniref:DNA replication factor Dna2 N-terminal domain-containing protein n=1 Tax=Amphimedon queenslandica TaxID=400682 RepID=A0A1X7SIK8_AMPQE